MAPPFPLRHPSGDMPSIPSACLYICFGLLSYLWSIPPIPPLPREGGDRSPTDLRAHENERGRGFLATALTFTQRVLAGQKVSLRLISPKEPNDTPHPSGVAKPCIPITHKSSHHVGLAHRGPMIGDLHERGTFSMVNNTSDVVTQKNWAININGKHLTPQGPRNIQRRCPLMPVKPVATWLSLAFHPHYLLVGGHPSVGEFRRPSEDHPACSQNTTHQLIVYWHN